MEDIEFLIINTHRQHKTYKNPTGDWLGIHYIASFLNENGINTLAFAGYAHEVPIILEKYILQSKTLKAVGFSCDYENINEIARFSQRVKTYDKNLQVIVGGPQALFLDKQFFEISQVDFIVYGEGELTCLELLQYLSNVNIDNNYKYDYNKLKNIKGIKYINKNSNSELVTTLPRPTIQNLDALPFPNSKYALGSLFRPTLASFLTGRGCPFQCAFCYEGSNTNGIRWRSVKNVIKEIKQVLDERPDIHYIMFTDDTFTINENRIKEFCKELKILRTEYDFTWFCEGHVKTLHNKPYLLAEMINAGLSCLQIGIESGCDEVLKAYNKNITTKMITDLVKSAYELGLEQLWGNIILGGALETRERIQKNLRFCQHLYELAPGMINMDVVYFWPLPGTKITTNPNEYGMKILDKNSDYSLMDFPVVEYENISRTDFCNIRTDFINTLENTAKKLVPKIPIKNVFRMIRNKNKSSNFAIWLRVILEVEEYAKFFTLLQVGATVLLADVSLGYLKTTHPMRTGHPSKFSEQGELILINIDNQILSLDETKLLCLASGKLDYLTLLERSNFSEEKFLSLLKQLENKRLLTFSKY